MCLLYEASVLAKPLDQETSERQFPEAALQFLGRGVLKICRKFTGEHPCRSAISRKLQSKLIEIALQYGCFPVNLLHIFRTPFSKNISRGLLLNFNLKVQWKQLGRVLTKFVINCWYASR